MWGFMGCGGVGDYRGSVGVRAGYVMGWDWGYGGGRGFYGTCGVWGGVGGAWGFMGWGGGGCDMVDLGEVGGKGVLKGTWGGWGSKWGPEETRGGSTGHGGGGKADMERHKGHSRIRGHGGGGRKHRGTWGA